MEVDGTPQGPTTIRQWCFTRPSTSSLRRTAFSVVGVVHLHARTRWEGESCAGQQEACEGLFPRKSCLVQKLTLLGDSSAARGFLHRQGAERTQPLHVKQLWVQERDGEKEVVVIKDARNGNWEDAACTRNRYKRFFCCSSVEG